MQEIFYIAHKSSQQQGKTSLIISWTSHAWRDLAHHTSKMWTCIDFKHPEWISTALSRSSSRGLEFNITPTSRNTKEDLNYLVPLCLGNLGRIKNLRIISTRDWDFWTSFPELRPEWTTPALLLVDLYLQHVHLPPNLFSGTYPSLRNLHLSSCGFDWATLPITPDLKRLYIEFPRSLATLNVIVDILQRISSLEELGITNALNNLTLGHNLPPNRIPFHQLKVLRLGDRDTNTLKSFLNQVSLPHLINADVTIPGWRESVIAKALTSARDNSRWEIDRLEICLNMLMVTLHVTEGLPANMHQADLQFEPTKARIAVIGGGGLNESQNLQILDYFGTQATVQRLHFEPQLIPCFMTSLNNQLDRLLTLTNDDPEGTLEVLGPDAKILAQSAFTFRHLRSLEVRGESPEREEDVMPLYRWLVWRNRAGLPRLEKLHLSGMTIPQIAKLRGPLNGLVVLGRPERSYP
ncbi:hypothetical protein BDN72DRAFT_878269 [Pluteus cervinus]|uniref:Uncharacterized protein n=1 Tax=Pluteus cervinus TaxID=181527 RepID=A0ACD3AVH5_9AGAR|nr:hypothetical protein BDN72DRAFT_878269 [Pluteus cervinus]